MNKVSAFPALATQRVVVIVPLSRIFLWVSPSVAEADIIVASGAKIF